MVRRGPSLISSPGNSPPPNLTHPVAGGTQTPPPPASAILCPTPPHAQRAKPLPAVGLLFPLGRVGEKAGAAKIRKGKAAMQSLGYTAGSEAAGTLVSAVQMCHAARARLTHTGSAPPCECLCRQPAGGQGAAAAAAGASCWCELYEGMCSLMATIPKSTRFVC